MEVADATSAALDDLLAAGPGAPVQLLKLDAQGYEVRVLRGAARLLASPSRPRAIQCRRHPATQLGGSELLLLTRS